MAEYSNVDGSWDREAGQVVQILRGRWVYGVISTLAEGPRTPRELHTELSDTHRRLRWLVGDRPMPEGVLYKPLAAMLREGLLQYDNEHPPAAFPQIARYRLSPLSECLLGSLGQLAPWCDFNQRYLEQMTMTMYGMDPESPRQDIGTPDERDEILLLRDRIGMAFGLFTPRWSWGLLSVISKGPRSAREIFAANADRIDSAPTTGRRTMPLDIGYEMLDWLVRCDLISTRDFGGADPSRVIYGPTELGSTLVNTFRPIGEAMAVFRRELVEALRERRGLDADNLPWPSALLSLDD